MKEPNPTPFCLCGCRERTNLAARDWPEQGWVKGRPLRYIRGHQRRKSPVAYLVDSATGCWLWQRATGEHGHGRMSSDGWVQPAHRVFYERHVGPVPEGHHLHHLCGTAACVNPAHVVPVLPDEHQGGRGHGRLLRSDARAIRGLAATGLFLQRELARAFGVSEQLISKVIIGQRWASA